MSLTDPGATRSIAASETSSVHVWLMVGVVAYALLGPVLVYRLRYRGRSARGRWLPGVGPPAAVRWTRGSSRRRLSLLAVATGLVLVVAAAVPSFTGGGAFSRNRALDIALELGRAWSSPSVLRPSGRP